MEAQIPQTFSHGAECHLAYTNSFLIHYVAMSSNELNAVLYPKIEKTLNKTYHIKIHTSSNITFQRLATSEFELAQNKAYIIILLTFRTTHHKPIEVDNAKFSAFCTLIDEREPVTIKPIYIYK